MKEKIKHLFSVLAIAAKDKVEHLLVGFVIAALVGLPVYHNCHDLFAGIWASLFPAVIAGAVKEWSDYQHDNKFDWRDLAYTAIGAVVVVLFIIGLHFGKG